jgi:tripartite-type tricarboxylate transporter receptor subunit TctC
MKLFFQTLLLVFSLGVAHTTTAQEQAYPHKLVRIVVPNGAGGPTDLIARIMAQKLSESMGQTFIVENRACLTRAPFSDSVTCLKPTTWLFKCSPP